MTNQVQTPDTTLDEFDRQLEVLARELTERAKTVRNGLAISLAVDASGSINLGFDRNEVITATKLRQAVNEGFLQLFELHEKHGGSLIHQLELQDTYDE